MGVTSCLIESTVSSGAQILSGFVQDEGWRAAEALPFGRQITVHVSPEPLLQAEARPILCSGIQTRVMPMLFKTRFGWMKQAAEGPV